MSWLNLPSGRSVAAALTGAATGFVFGSIADKIELSSPRHVIRNFALSDTRMVEFVSSSVGTGALVMGTLHFLGKMPQCVKDVVPRGLVIGSLMMGSSMAFVGACPGTLPAQIGAASAPAAPYVLVGGLAGAAAFGYAYPYIKEKCIGKSLGKLTVSGLTGLRPWILAIPTAIVFGGLAFLLKKRTEKVEEEPAEADVDIQEETVNTSFKDRVLGVLRMQTWPAGCSGATVGLLQVPLLLIVGTPLGVSTIFSTVAAKLLSFVDKSIPSHPYFGAVISGPKNWYQFFFHMGVVGGAWLSSHYSGYRARNVIKLREMTLPLLTKFVAFSGGFCMIFGSRLAGGCPSGHGISGLAQLSVAGLISMPITFLAATCSAVGLKKLCHCKQPDCPVCE